MSSASSEGVRRWSFVGQNALGGAALKALAQRLGPPSLVVTREVKPEHDNEVEAVAAAIGARLERAVDYRLDEYIADFAHSEVLICCGWARSIPQHVFSTPESGAINLHPGSLPLWAGSDPIGWQLAVGSNPLEYTVHRMTGRVDVGQVLAVGQYSASPSETGLELRRAIGHRLGVLASDAVVGGQLPVVPAASPQRATPPRGLTPAITPATMKREVVDRVLRAFSPYPGVLMRSEGSILEVRVPSADRALRRVECIDGSIVVEVIREFRET